MKRIAEDSVWQEIYGIHPVIALRCREAFKDPVQLAVSVSDYDIATSTVEECLGDSVAAHSKPALVEKLDRLVL